jgi:hypothetical protein
VCEKGDRVLLLLKKAKSGKGNILPRNYFVTGVYSFYGNGTIVLAPVTLYEERDTSLDTITVYRRSSGYETEIRSYWFTVEFINKMRLYLGG